MAAGYASAQAAIRSALAGDLQAPCALRELLRDQPVLGAFSCGEIARALRDGPGSGPMGSGEALKGRLRVLEVLVASALASRQTMAALAGFLFDSTALQSDAAQIEWRLRLMLAAALLGRVDGSPSGTLAFVAALAESVVEEAQAAVVCGGARGRPGAEGDTPGTELAALTGFWPAADEEAQLREAAGRLAARAGDCGLSQRGVAVLRSLARLPQQAPAGHVRFSAAEETGSGREGAAPRAMHAAGVGGRPTLLAGEALGFRAGEAGEGGGGGGGGNERERPRNGRRRRCGGRGRRRGAGAGGAARG